VFVRRIAENVLSQDVELVGTASAKCSIFVNLGKQIFQRYSLAALNVPDC
jgi:hypothetical protein